MPPLLQAEQADARPARPGNHGNEAADPSLIQTQVAKIQRTSTATPASCWAACSGLGCLSCGVVLPLLCAVSPLMPCGAIVLADPANHRRLSQQNPSKLVFHWCLLADFSCLLSILLVEVAPVQEIPTKTILRYGRCAAFSVLLFEIPGVSNAKAVRFWFCFYVQIRIAWHVRAISLAPGRFASK